MAKFDRYMLSQLLLFFGFFSLVLVAVFWVSRSVDLFDRLIGDGQSVLVFLEFSALGLPRIVQMVMPLAAFAAAVFVTNRLTTESEITVMQAIGSSPWRLTRPVLMFSLVVGVMSAALTIFLVPASMDQLKIREREIDQDIAARLLTEGAFLHPASGVTLYIRKIGEDGVLKEVFLSNRRDPNARLIYTADRAYLVKQDDATSLIMVDGLAQRYTPSNGRLSTTTFDDYSQDISGLFDDSSSLATDIRAFSTLELTQGWSDLAQNTGYGQGTIAEELHSRFAQPLFAMSTALFGFAVLISSGFTRLSTWREVLGAFTILLVLDSTRAALADPVRDNWTLWPLMYGPPAAAFLIVLAFLAYTARPRRRGKEVTA